MNALILRTRDRVADIRRRLTDGSRLLMRRAKPGVIDDAVPYQDGVEEILEQKLPKALRPTTFFIVYLFFLLLVLASVMDVDVVVVSSGRIITDTPTIVLQPLENAIIRELNVDSGTRVTKGQVLATLDPTFTQADVSSLSQQQRSLQAQERRLEAELAGQPFEAGANPSSDDLLQANLYQQRQAEYRSRIQVFDEEILRLRANIQSVSKDIDLIRQELGVARDVEGMRSALEKSQTGSRLQLLDSQASRMRTERDYHDAINRLTESQHSLESKQAERISFGEEWRRTLLDTLVTLRTNSASAGGGLAKAALMRNLVVFTAPEDGVVQEVAKLSVGSVARGAEPLITIVPSRAKLTVEIMIASADMGFIKPQDSVALKVDAFPYHRHGMLSGRLTSISEDTVVQANPNTSTAGGGAEGTSSGGSTAFYRGRVELLTTKLERLPKSGRLIPGMTVTAEIKVGVRSIISYFLSPVSSGLGVSFREP